MALDTYGGYASLPVPGGATGYFRIGQMGDRLVLVSPSGNAFWMRSVYVMAPTPDYLEKYADGEDWGTQANRRLKAWGFNTIGENQNPNCLPVRSFGGTFTNPEPLPFIRLIKPGLFSLNNRWGWAGQPNPENGHGVKSLILGLDATAYTGYRGGPLADVFDPNYEATVAGVARDTITVATATTSAWAPQFWRASTPTGLTTSPWVIGTSVEDADYAWGFKRSTDPHLGWMVFANAPTQTGPATPYTSITVTAYINTTCFSKLAARDFLQARYTTVAALNSAWGSSYTTWDSAGGWPTGTGVLDESGRSAWMATTAGYSVITNAAVRQDLDDIMYLFARKYYDLQVQYLREPGVQPNHLVFNQMPFHDGRPIILQAAADAGLDAVQLHVSSFATTTGGQPGLAELETGYLETSHASFPGPVFFWITFIAQEDSPMVGEANAWGPFDNATQEARGTAYAAYLQRLLNWRSAVDGINHVMGIDWWAWTDSAGEGSNFGLVSLKDNAYDGAEAIIAAGTDPWGYTTGGEAGNYGNFLGAVTVAHAGIEANLAGSFFTGASRHPAAAIAGAL